MKSHPILGHIHDHRQNCKIIDAQILDNLVVYNYKNPNAKIIITLEDQHQTVFIKTLVLEKLIHITSINFVKKRVNAESSMQVQVVMETLKNF